MAEQLIVVPDIGTDDSVEVIEINVKVGDKVSVEDTLITLESEKASMEIPTSVAGEVASILLKVGDKVVTGAHILKIKPDSEHKEIESKSEVINKIPEMHSESLPESLEDEQVNSNNITSNIISEVIAITIPDIGTDNKVEVIEIQVKPGDNVAKEDALITLESEKASMDIPAPQSGVVKDISLKVGDKVAVGDVILYLAINNITNTDKKTKTDISKISKEVKQPHIVEQSFTSVKSFSNIAADNKYVYASPSVRRFANDLGVNLIQVVGTGRKNRILKIDVEHYVKSELSKIQSNTSAKNGLSGNGLGLELASLPEIDFSKFGNVTSQPLKRIQKISASNLHRNWVMIPHVTQFDEADISDMESFRQKYKKQAEAKGYKLTPLVFLMRAAAQALKLMPQFNVSLSNDGVNIIQKHYYHIGIAVDTPNGLVVPVIRDVDQKGLFQLAHELAEISQKAREGKLQAKDMQGGCFSISSLGGIGGTAFTPIINAPEVAILGISKSQMKPVYQNGEFMPRLMLPLSLSYDHRAIDGAAAAKFITLYSQLLGDISQLLL